MDDLLLDAENQILGRLASYAAKQAIKGSRVIVLNAEKAVISGKRRSIIEDAKMKLRTRTLGSQSRAPQHPRRADIYVRRAIRGMLPQKKAKGMDALHRILVFAGVPDEFAGKPMIKVTGADASKLTSHFMTVKELTEEIGGSS